jgi:hypothetical protein
MVRNVTLMAIRQFTRLARVDGKASMNGIQQALSMFDFFGVPVLPQTDGAY